MNYVDIAIIVLLVLAFFLGFIGKLSHKITHLVMLALSLALAFILGTVLADSGLADKIISWFKLESYVEMMKEASPQFLVLFGGIKRFILFFAFSLVLFLIFGFFGIIINHALFKSKKKQVQEGEKKKFKNTALFGGQIISVVWMAVLLLFFLTPVAAFRGPAKTAVTMNYSEDHTPTTVDKVFDQVDGSKMLAFTDKILEKKVIPFMSYSKTDSEGKVHTYYLNEDANGVDRLLGILKNFKSKRVNLSGLSLEDKESISKALDALGEALTEVDAMREEYGDDTTVTIIIGDLVKYVFSDVAEEAKPQLLKSLMNGGSEYLEGFDYYKDPYKDKVPSVLVQVLVDKTKSSDSSMADLLKYVDVHNYTFEELKANILSLPDLLNLFTSKTVKTEQEVKSALTASPLCKQVLKRVMEKYYGVGSINFDNLDFDKEALAISTVLNYANASDTSVIDAVAFAHSLGESDILPALIDYYNGANPDSKIEIKVDTVKYAAINAALATELAAGSLTTKQYETYRNIFKAE